MNEATLTGRRYRFEVYKDAHSEWRWRLRSAKNGKIVADSAESYKRRSTLLTQIGNIRRHAKDALVFVLG